MPASHAPVFAPTDYFREAAISEIFDEPGRPLELDLGCGDGTFLVKMAGQHPERSFLGVERLAGRVEKTAKRIRQSGLTNVRVLRLETNYTLNWLLPEGCAARVHLLCPDPWPKKKHEQRQLFRSADFLRGIARVLAPGGELLLKTDDRPYHQQALEAMARQAGFRRLEWREDDFPYARTDFEVQWLALGKTLERARWMRL